MLRTSYSYAVARIRGLELKILDLPFFEHLINESPDIILKNIKETYLLESFEDINKPEDFNTGILKNKKQTLNLLENISPEKNIIKILKDQYDFHNAKSLLLEKYFAVNSKELLSNLGFVDINTLRTAIFDEKYHELKDEIKNVLWSFNFKENHSTQDVVTYIDDSFNKYVIAVLSKYNVYFLLNYYRQKIDLINIQMFLKIKTSNMDPEIINKSILAEGFINKDVFHKHIFDSIDDFKIEIEKTKYDHILNEATNLMPNDISLFYTDRVIDNHFENYFKKTHYTAFGVEPLFSYYFEKQRELRRIACLFTGSLSKINKDEMKKRMF